MPLEKVLVVDDEKLVRWSLRQKCQEWGYQVMEAPDGNTGIRIAQAESPDLVLLDVRLPDIGGLEVLRNIRENARAVIMITADPQLEDVKQAIKLGAYDFIGKPLDFDELGVTVKNALEANRLRTEVETLRGEVKRRTGVHEVIAESKKMQDVMGFVNKVAASEASTILIQGESGTGKDLIAKGIHYTSSRQEKPFVAVNCSAIPETLMEAELFGHERGAFTDAKAMKKGLFEVADGGTLFLDEIGELSPLLQAKMLRVLEDQIIRRVGGIRDMQVNVRVIAASNRDLEKMVQENTFRQDLFYRLAIISIFLPRFASAAKTFCRWWISSSSVTTRSSARAFAASPKKPASCCSLITGPGNVRELKNAIERAMILEEEQFLRPTYMPFAVGHQHSGLTAFEKISGPDRRPIAAEWTLLTASHHPRRRNVIGRGGTRVG